jgi:hypothetical protein
MIVLLLKIIIIKMDYSHAKKDDLINYSKLLSSIIKIPYKTSIHGKNKSTLVLYIRECEKLNNGTVPFEWNTTKIKKKKKSNESTETPIKSSDGIISPIHFDELVDDPEEFQKKVTEAIKKCFSQIPNNK